MNKAFRFRLKRLLDLRRIEEREAESAALQAQARLAALDAAFAALRSEREGLMRDLSAAAGRPAEARLVLEHEARLEAGLRGIETERDVARRAASAAEAELLRRRAARRALEELEGRARELWSEEARRLETTVLDEVASMRRAASQDVGPE